MSQNGSTKIIILIILALSILIAGVWYVIGKNRIISAVPQNGKEGEQVILVTPRATPTSEFEPSPTLTEEELSVTPTEKPKATTAPTETEEATGTPEPTEEEPTETPTPTPEA